MSWIDDRYNKILKWVDGHEYEDFIDENEIEEILSRTKNAGKDEVRAVIKKAKENAVKGTMLTPYETAVLLNNSHDEIWDEIFDAATEVKEEVYGNRMVLFSPLYISSPCVNNCKYCGFAAENTAT